MSAPVRRIVTGLDGEGRSCIQSDGPSPTVIWESDASPADNSGSADAGGGEHKLAFAPGAAQFLWFEMPPGAAAPLHATDTIDYIVCIAGEAVVVTETGEAVLRAGDVVVQRGTLHGWRNDGDVPFRSVGVMMAAHPVGAGADISALMAPSA